MNTVIPIERLGANEHKITMHSQCSSLWLLGLWHCGMFTDVQVQAHPDPSLWASVWLETNPFISESHRAIISNADLLRIQLFHDIHSRLTVCIAYKLSNSETCSWIHLSIQCRQ